MEDESSILLEGKSLGNLRVVDLKHELEKRGLSKSGSKKDLVKRLKQQLEFEKLCGERKLTGDCDLKLELDADTEQNEFVQQYLAQQQKIYAEQKEVKRLVELEEIQKSSDEKESCDSTREDEDANVGEDDQTEEEEEDASSYRESSKAEVTSDENHPLSSSISLSIECPEVPTNQENLELSSESVKEPSTSETSETALSSTSMEPVTQFSSVPYSLSDIQLPESPGSIVKPSSKASPDHLQSSDSHRETQSNGINSVGTKKSPELKRTSDGESECIQSKEKSDETVDEKSESSVKISPTCNKLGPSLKNDASCDSDASKERRYPETDRPVHKKASGSEGSGSEQNSDSDKGHLRRSRESRQKKRFIEKKSKRHKEDRKFRSKSREDSRSRSKSREDRTRKDFKSVEKRKERSLKGRRSRSRSAEPSSKRDHRSIEKVKGRKLKENQSCRSKYREDSPKRDHTNIKRRKNSHDRQSSKSKSRESSPKKDSTSVKRKSSEERRSSRSKSREGSPKRDSPSVKRRKSSEERQTSRSMSREGSPRKDSTSVKRKKSSKEQQSSRGKSHEDSPEKDAGRVKKRKDSKERQSSRSKSREGSPKRVSTSVKRRKSSEDRQSSKSKNHEDSFERGAASVRRSISSKERQRSRSKSREDSPKRVLTHFKRGKSSEDRQSSRSKSREDIYKSDSASREKRKRSEGNRRSRSKSHEASLERDCVRIDQKKGIRSEDIKSDSHEDSSKKVEQRKRSEDRQSSRSKSRELSPKPMSIDKDRRENESLEGERKSKSASPEKKLEESSLRKEKLSSEGNRKSGSESRENSPVSIERRKDGEFENASSSKKSPLGAERKNSSEDNIDSKTKNSETLGKRKTITYDEEPASESKLPDSEEPSESKTQNVESSVSQQNTDTSNVEPARQRLKIKRDNVIVSNSATSRYRFLSEAENESGSKRNLSSDTRRKSFEDNLATRNSETVSKRKTITYGEEPASKSRLPDSESKTQNAESAVSQQNIGTSKEEPAHQKVTIDCDNVDVSNSATSRYRFLSEEAFKPKESKKNISRISISEKQNQVKTEEVPVVPYVSSRKISLSSRKITEKSEEELKGKRSKWGSFAASKKALQNISISTDSLKTWFPDFKLLKEPVTPNEVVPEEVPLPFKEQQQHKGMETTPIKKLEEVEETREEGEELSEDPIEETSATKILFVQNLVRPFTLHQLKELLNENGHFLEENFWIDKIKSKCFVTYETEEESIKTRNSLNGTRWPSSNPKILSVEFSTEEELNSHKSGSELPKPAPQILPEPEEPYREARPMHAHDENRRKDQEVERKRDHFKVLQPVREWDKDKLTQESPERERHDRDKLKISDKKEKKDAKRRTNEDTPAKLLDDLFQKTKSSPCIYWLPLTDVQVQERIESQRVRKLEREKRNQQREQEEHKSKQGRRAREVETRRSSSRSRSPVTRRR